MTTQLLSRDQLGLRAPSGAYRLIEPEGITLHYAGDSPWRLPVWHTVEQFLALCDHRRCPSIWRAWQDFHMSPGALGTITGAIDIAYSSGVCPHGVRLEGRGAGHRTAANGTNVGNTRSLAVVYLAGVGDPLTDPAKLGFLDESIRYSLPLRWEHAQWYRTSCPGTPLSQWRQQGCPRPDGSVQPHPAPIVPPLIATSRLFILEDDMNLTRTVYPLPPLKRGRGYWDLDGSPGRPLVPAGRCMSVVVNGADGYPEDSQVHGAEPFDYDGHTRVRLWGFSDGDAPSIVVTSLTD